MNVGFKEWAVICDALGSGRQSIIVRKGGIAEGRDGFRFKHDAFFLFPTLYHEQVNRTTLPDGTALPTAPLEGVKINYFARIAFTTHLTDPRLIDALAPYHIWSNDEIVARFGYGEEQGLNLAVVRTFRLSRPWCFPDQPAYGGCRSWVQLPAEIPDGIHSPVLDDAAHLTRVEEIKTRLASG